MKINYSNKAVQWAVLLFLALIWGSSFILMKRGLESFTYEQVGAFRIFISFLLFLPIIYHKRKFLQKKYLKSLAIVAIAGTAIPAFLFTKAQTEITSSLAGMINALTPFFTLIIGLLVYHAKSAWYNKLGVATGLIGALGLVYVPDNSVFSGNNWYAIFAIVATMCYGWSVNENKFKIPDLNGVTVASLGFIFIGPPAGIFLLFSDFSQAAASENLWFNFGCIFTLSTFGSFLALMIFNTLIKHTSALFASSVTYIIPIFAILWGILDGEKISVIQTISISIILLGVYMVNKKEKNVEKL